MEDFDRQMGRITAIVQGRGLGLCRLDVPRGDVALGQGKVEGHLEAWEGATQEHIYEAVGELMDKGGFVYIYMAFIDDVLESLYARGGI